MVWMNKSEILSKTAQRFPSIFREIVTLSIRGFLPPIHKHWWFRAQAANLFGGSGFPMRYGSCRLYIPQDLQTVYLGYFDMWNHEPLTSRVLVEVLKKDEVVVDVGANIGYFTLLAASLVGPKGRVHAVECSPETLAILENNVRKNSLRNVTIHPVAAAKERGTLSLNVTAIGLSWLTPHANWPTSEGRQRIVSVPAVPLDEIIQSPVHFIKIDAEGLDLDVLKGMKRILAENTHLSLIVEWAPALLAEAGRDPLELPQWLQEAGFREIFVLDEHSQKKRTLKESIGMVTAGTLPHDWVGDLVAQK
jgi:FkbM family methyltransferase